MTKSESMETILRNQLKSHLQEKVNELFKKYPTVESVSWRQYTPYFNDGEDCVFEARLSRIDVKLYSEEKPTMIPVSSLVLQDGSTDKIVEKYYPYTKKSTAISYKDGKYEEGEYSAPDYSRPETKIRDILDSERFAIEFTRLFLDVGDDFLKAIYGDHISVTLKLDSCEIEEYEHD